MRAEYRTTAGLLPQQALERQPLRQPPAPMLAGTDRSSAAMDALRAAGGTAIMRSMPGGVVVFDHDLRYASAGGVGLSDAGFPPSMLEGRTISQVWPPQVVTVIEPLYREALAGHTSDIDIPLRGRIFRQQLGPLRDGDGRIVAGIGYTQDVTQERRSERDLDESERRFRLAFSNTPFASALIGFDGRYQQVNPAMCRMLGYPESRLLALAISDVTHPDDLDRDLAAMAALGTGEQDSHRLEKRYLTATGETIWAMQTASVVRREDGSPLQIVAQIQDITARREYEHNLAEEQRRFRDAEQIGRVGSWEMDVRTGEITWSRGVFELYGIDPDTFDGDHRKAMRCIEAGLAATAEYRILRADGQVRWIRATAAPVADADGNLGRSASTVEDITESRDATAALQAAHDAERAGAAKNEFLSRMSHELRTPLNAVLGFAQLLQLDPLTDDQRSAVGHILQGGQDLVGLIDEVLDISGIGTDQPDVDVPEGQVVELPTESDTTAPTVQPTVLLDQAGDSPRRIMLYVEDNTSNIELMKRLVGRRPGWQLLVADNGAQGLELATTTSPDLILLDLQLPDGHGSEILQRLRANPETADLRVVVVSADAHPLQIDRLLAAGAHAYLTKPLDLAKVLELMT